MSDHIQVSMRDEVERLEQEIREIREEASETAEGTEEAQTLRARFQSAQGRLKVFQRKLKDWGDDTFTIRRLSYSEMMIAVDDVSSQSSSVDKSDESFRMGGYKIRILEDSVVDTPSGAPNSIKDKDFPYQIGEWLYEKVDNLNTVGEVDLGNSLEWKEETGEDT